MQCLELSGAPAVHGWNDEVTDDRHRGHRALRCYRIDQGASHLEGVRRVVESIAYPSEAAFSQFRDLLIHVCIFSDACAAGDRRCAWFDPTP
jgi:hypothetical protein